MGTKSVKKAFCVDHWILENNGYEYQNKRSEIIQEYLYDGKGVDLSEFDIRNYDIDLLCNIACCGLDTEDGVDVRTINEHIKKIYSDSELEEDSTIRNFRIVQTEGSRQVTRDTKHYNLQMIIAVGFKVNSERAVQFRKWVNQIAKDYTIKGWVMDDERLKRVAYLTEKYFDEQLERIREIRASERMFYQKITDLYATAIDYDKEVCG